MTASAVRITGAAQHEAWTAKAMPPVEVITEGLWSIPVPIPHSPLRYVNVYALTDGKDVVLIDAGWDSPEAWSALQAGLASQGASMSDVRGVLVSHLHFDHLGLARRVKEASGAWVAMHEADRTVLLQPAHRVPGEARDRDRAFIRSLGAPAEEIDGCVGSLEELALFTETLIPERVIADHDRVDVPGGGVTAVHTPGHTPGHLCFVDDQGRWLFAGDHLLPRITPNISVHPSWHDDPLTDYLASLEKVAQLDAEEVLPAHEWRYVGHADRARSIRDHHTARSSELVGIVERMPGMSPWDLAAELSWSRPWAQYEGRMRVSAVTETAAHANHLVSRGVLIRSEADVATYVVA